MLEWLTFGAIIMGPILAVQVDKFLSRTRENRKRKIDVFISLMKTRGTPICSEHFTALNLIEVEFGKDKKYSTIIKLWRVYLDNLENGPQKQEDSPAWNEKNSDLLADLLVSMADSLGFQFDKVTIKRKCYVPRGFVDNENNKNFVIDRLVKVFDENIPIPFTLVVDSKVMEDQTELSKQMTKYYQNLNDHNNTE